MCESILADIFTWREHHCDLDCVIAGDFHVNLNNTDNAIVKCINSYINFLSLFRADVLFPSAGNFTYANDSLQYYSYIDYMLTSCTDSIVDFTLCEPFVYYGYNR